MGRREKEMEGGRRSCKENQNEKEEPETGDGGAGLVAEEEREEVTMQRCGEEALG